MQDDFVSDFMEKFKAWKVKPTMFDRNKITAPFQVIIDEQAVTLKSLTSNEFRIYIAINKCTGAKRYRHAANLNK